MALLINQNIQVVPTKKTFLMYYQGLLALVVIIIFFTRLDVYLGHRGVGIPLYWLILVMIAGIPIFLGTLRKLNQLAVPVILWCGFYLTVPLISIVVLPQITDIQLFEDQIRSVIFLMVMLTIFSQHEIVLWWTKLAVFMVTIANVFMFIWEFFNPTAFYAIQDAAGRSSGFYTDSNIAGMALMIGLIFTIDLIKPRYRLFFSLFILVGVLSTFSRGAMVIWGIVIIMFLINKVIPLYQLPFMLLAAFMILSIISTQLSNLAFVKTADGTELFNEGTMARVEFLLNPFGQEDSSSDSRLGHVEEAWAKFDKQPILGNGLGSGASKNKLAATGENQRSHNIYLDQMVEFGIIGALIYPLLLFSCVWKAKGKIRKYVPAFVFSLLFWGLFSHTTLNSFFLLTSYAVMANFCYQSRMGSLT